MRSIEERLRDILEAIEHIERYSERGKEAMERDELIQSWFVRHIQIIGEAVRLLPEDVRAREPDIPWRSIIGMRHILVHDYFGLDTEAVWKVVSQDLAALKEAATRLLEAEADRE